MSYRPKLAPGAEQAFLDSLTANQPSLEQREAAEKLQKEIDKAIAAARAEQKKADRFAIIKADYKTRYLQRTPMTDAAFEKLWTEKLEAQALEAEANGNGVRVGMDHPLYRW